MIGQELTRDSPIESKGVTAGGAPAVSVIICTYNRAPSLRATLRSLADTRGRPEISWEVIVVDNNSSDDTRTAVEEFAGTSGLSVRYLFEGRQGKSFALNTGIVAARGEVLAFTDDDVEVASGWVTGIWEGFQKHDCAGIGEDHPRLADAEAGLAGRRRTVPIDAGDREVRARGLR
jgi:glycosyltransferase involved in cell wall biosynthesis